MAFVEAPAGISPHLSCEVSDDIANPDLRRVAAVGSGENKTLVKMKLSK